MSVVTEGSTSDINTGVADGVISANSSYALLGSTSTSLLIRCVGRTGIYNSSNIISVVCAVKASYSLSGISSIDLSVCYSKMHKNFKIK
jgi:hypothetical protein